MIEDIIKHQKNKKQTKESCYVSFRLFEVFSLG